MSEDEREPLDLTLREVFGVVGDASYSDDFQEALEMAKDRGLAPRQLVAEAFQELHPAPAGDLLRAIANGLDEGYTAQGAYHPDFQRDVDRITRDPDDLYRTEGDDDE